MLKNDVVKLCQDNNFSTGFFEGSDSSYAVDAYELKVIFPFQCNFQPVQIKDLLSFSWESFVLLYFM